jgi:hypothetical protein
MQDNCVPGSRLLPDGSMLISIHTVKRPRAKAPTDHQKKQPSKAKKPTKVLKTAAMASNRADMTCLGRVELQPDPLYHAYIYNAAAFPNPSTHRTYINNIQRLRRLNQGLPVKELILPSPQPMLLNLMQAAQSLGLKHWTVRLMLTSLISLLNNVLSRQAKAKPEVQRVMKQLQYAHRQAKRAAVRQPKDGSGWLSHQQLCSIRDGITQPTQAKLLFSFLTATAPRIEFRFRFNPKP